jgi:hypothetical protein
VLVENLGLSQFYSPSANSTWISDQKSKDGRNDPPNSLEISRDLF